MRIFCWRSSCIWCTSEIHAGVENLVTKRAVRLSHVHLCGWLRALPADCSTVVGLRRTYVEVCLLFCRLAEKLTISLPSIKFPAPVWKPETALLACLYTEWHQTSPYHCTAFLRITFYCYPQIRVFVSITVHFFLIFELNFSQLMYT